MHILEVRKFTSKNDNSRRYITIIADCKASRDNIVRLGPLNLFGKNINAEHPIPKRQFGPNTRPPDAYSS